MYDCGCGTTSHILQRFFQVTPIFKWLQCTSIFFWNINLSEIPYPSNRWLNMVLADEVSSLTFHQCTIEGLHITASESNSRMLSLKEILIIGPFSIKYEIIVPNLELPEYPVIKVLNYNGVFNEYLSYSFILKDSLKHIQLNTEFFPSPWPRPSALIEFNGSPKLKEFQKRLKPGGGCCVPMI
jgi:hypothetical protein